MNREISYRALRGEFQMPKRGRPKESPDEWPTLGKLIKILMDRKGLGVKDLAIAADVGESTIYHILDGTQPNTSPMVLRGIADALGTSILTLYAETEGVTEKDVQSFLLTRNLDKENTSPEWNQLTQYYLKLGPKHRKILTRALISMTEAFILGKEEAED